MGESSSLSMQVTSVNMLMLAIAAIAIFSGAADAKEHAVPKVELWHGGATRVSDPDPVLLRYTVTGGAVTGFDSRIACNSIELMKTPAQDKFDFHFKGTPVKHHRAHVALLNDGKLVSTGHTDFEYFKPGSSTGAREEGLSLKMLGSNKVTAGGRTELQYNIGVPVSAGMKVKIAVSGMQLMDLDAEASYKFHFDNVPKGSYVCYAALFAADGKLLHTDLAAFEVVEGAL